MSPSENVHSSRTLQLAIIPIGVLLNWKLGVIVNTFKLPVYLDEVGAILVVLLAGLRTGIIVGVLSFTIGGLVVNPVWPYFTGTQIAVALYTFAVRRIGGYRTIFRSVIAGIGLGIVAAIVSAPVIAILFKGVTGSGVSFFTALLMRSGRTMIESIALSGIAAEPIDKTAQTLIAVSLLRGIPRSILDRFKAGLLKENGFAS